MTEPSDATIDQPGRGDLHEQETVAPSDSAAELAGILDRYMAELKAGKCPGSGPTAGGPSGAGRAARGLPGRHRVRPPGDRTGGR